MKPACLLIGLLVFLPFGTVGQNLCPNPSAEIGTSDPTDWTGAGVWADWGRTGARSLSIVGNTNTFKYWQCAPNVEQGRPYIVRYYSTAASNSSGFISGGLTTAKKDFTTRPPTVWADYSYVAWVPSNGTPTLRLEVWYGNGTVNYDDVEVLPANPVFRQVGPYRLSSGESLQSGRYVFSTQYESYGANYSRALHRANTSFNTSRWYMDPPVNIVYRHELDGQSFSNAQISCGIMNYNNITSTSLWVEASTDATNWQFVGGLLNTHQSTFVVPASLLPAPELFVRLRSVAAQQFALTNYSFAADVPDNITSGVGETHYFGQWLTNSAIRIASVEALPEGKAVTVQIFNPAANAQSFELLGQTRYSDVTRERSTSVEVPSGETNWVSLVLPTAGFGENTALITVRDSFGTNLFQESLTFTVSIIADDSYGELLPSPTNLPVWWCEGPYKVGLRRLPPTATNAAVQISAARNEYEPFQMVLRPLASLSNITVSIGDFICLTNPAQTIGASNVTICRTEYVPVTKLMGFEVYSATGDYPDPLVPLAGSFAAPAGTNSPLWFTVYVPKDAPAGLYEATVTVSSESGLATFPVRLTVYDFTLTDVTHTKTAYNVYIQSAWHGLGAATEEQKAAVWELYLQNMARHRVSPYFPQFFDPILYAYNSGNGTFTHNFNEFDVAMERYLEEYDFNTFKDITVERSLPVIPGVPYYTASSNAINPTYRSLYRKLMQPVIQHFRERGWFDKAYTFWIDEPSDSLLPLVRDGMNMVEETAPDTARLFPKQNGPVAEFGGNVWAVLWEGLNLTAAAERMAAGNKVWSYMAMRPPAPWPNSFVDHPAINPRFRSWYVEKLNLDGEVYWAINYYSSTNPWVYPMGLIPGPNPAFLGNGDGVFVYPPTKEYPATPLIAGPYDSIRWEMNRDGMEDGEYFWTLKRALEAAKASLGTNNPVVLEGEAAYAEAMQITVWPVSYPYEPDRVLAVRDRIARAIEALDDGSPYLAKEPLSKVVKVGSDERLRVEVVGWPQPTIQWQHQGTNIPGALGAKLSLTNITASMAGEYRVVAFNSSGSVTSAVGRLTVLNTNQPPVVIKHPDSVVRTNGARAVFGCGVSSLTPVTHQWLFNGSPLAGATNVTLLLSNLNFGHSGFYTVLASNAYGSVTSAPAQLAIAFTNGSTPPVITSQPTNQMVSSGDLVEFVVMATGTAPLAYQWSRNGTNVSSGGTSNVLVLAGVQTSQAGNYRVVVANAVGSVTSMVATLTVQEVPPVFVSQPTNVTVVQGQSAQFSGTAGGSKPLSYQWFFNETNALLNANSDVLIVTNVQPVQAGVYSLLVTNAFGAITSAPALLQIAGMPAYTDEPPAMTLLFQDPDWQLALAPDNRWRTVLVSSNLVQWETYASFGPSAQFEYVPLVITNVPGSFFRIQVTP